MPRTLAEAIAATLPDTAGGWAALFAESLLSGLESPFTWIAVLLGGTLGLACRYMDGNPRRKGRQP